MAEKKKYNSILISGRKDETLTYSRYIKDEESGESVKETLDKKVNVTDELTTQQIKDGAITNEKLAADSVGNGNIQDGSVSNEKLEDGSVTNEKLAVNSITKDKLKDNTIGVEKLDPELRQTINAATGLPEDLVETIQNVDDTLKDHQSQLDDKQSQIDDKQQQITANDEDISLLQTRSTQMEETIKSIAATGGASQATAVTYNNEKSKLTAVNIQSAVDEVVDKVAIKDEEGTLVETPFRYIQNEEFIFAKVDAEDKLLFGIQWDGTPVFGKTSAVEDRLLSQVNLLAERVATIMGDEDTTNFIDTMNELKKFFAEIENTQTLTSILANLDKTTIKDEEGNVQDTPFREIENEEFIMAVVDSEDRYLFGIYRATGKPYFPLNEMYHVEQNEEFFALWLDADNKILLGIRRDGQIIGEIHAVNALKQVISQLQSDLASLQEKVGTIDTNLKELLDVFSLQENPEYMAVETDAEGKILSSTNADGSHYIHNAKSETIPEEFSHIEDPEGRTEITTDADGKILGYRDSEGTRHEHKISANHLELSDEAATEVSKAFKSAGIKMENPSDFSKDSHIELPIPRIAAQVRLYATKLPTTKQDDIYAEIEYNDKDGNYFRKLVILNAQGDSSLVFAVKNMAIDIADGSEIKFGDFPAQDSFHLKKYYIDAFRGQCIVGYWLIEQMYKSRPIGQQYPYEYNYSNDSTTEGLGSPKKDFFTGAKCHPDGFPIVITWVNPVTKEETNMGIYTWNLKKSKEVYNAEKKKAENIILDGVVSYDTLFGGTINWSAFEIRNPKNLIDINGNKYDGDKPTELSNTDKLSKRVKDYLVGLSKVGEELANSNTKEVFEKYFLVNPFIDYFLFSDLTYNSDGLRKNWIWLAYNGKKFTPSVYDVDSIFGSHYMGLYIINKSTTDVELVKNVYPCNILYDLYKDAIEARYSELRKLGIFTLENISKLLDKWITSVGYDNYVSEFALYAETPSYRANNINEGWKFLKWAGDIDNTYDGSKLYAEGETCIFYKCKFEATKNISGVEPAKVYKQYPFCMGMYNSKTRVLNWIAKRIETLDIFYNYK
jgi:hypothetical protein